MPIDNHAYNRDPKQANSRVVFGDFKGLAPTQSPHGGEPGLSAWQVNCYAVQPGELRCRPGLKIVTFQT